MQFRKCDPTNLETLHIMFESAHVTGASATIPGDFSTNSNEDDVQEIEKSPMIQNRNDKKRKTSGSTCVEEKEERSLLLRLYKQTCSKIEEGVDKITTSVEVASTPTTSQIPTIAEAMKMLRECGVQEGTALMHTSTLLIIKPEIRELLKSFETLERRLDWLKREHEMKHLP